ncbi:MAG: hypothetical protein Q9160_007608 [Pyrenula sp. 1 TL-2023]
MCFGSRLKGAQFSDINSSQPIPVRPVDLADSGSGGDGGGRKPASSDPTKQSYDGLGSKEAEAGVGAKSLSAEGKCPKLLLDSSSERSSCSERNPPPPSPLLSPGSKPVQNSASSPNNNNSTSSPNTAPRPSPSVFSVLKPAGVTSIPRSSTTATADKSTTLSPSDVKDPQMKERLEGKKSAHMGGWSGWQGPMVN